MVDCYGIPGKSITQPSRHSRGEKKHYHFLLLLLLRRNITLQSDVNRDGKNLQTCFQFTRELSELYQRHVILIHHPPLPPHHRIILARIFPPHFYNKVSKPLPYRMLSCITNLFISLLKCGAKASLVSQWIRIYLPMQGTHPGPGRFHMPRSNWAHELQPLNPRAATTEYYPPRAFVQQEKPIRSPHTTMKLSTVRGILGKATKTQGNQQ